MQVKFTLENGWLWTRVPVTKRRIIKGEFLFGILCQARESGDSCSNQTDLHGLLVYGSPTRLHKGYANKSRAASGKKAGPFKSHGIIPSWCNILLRIRILRIYWFGWLWIFILRNSETSVEIYLSQNRYLIINKLHFPSISCNGVLQGAHSIPLHIPIPSTLPPMRKLPYRSRSLLQYGSSHVFLCPLCKFLMSRLQDRCPSTPGVK